MVEYQTEEGILAAMRHGTKEKTVGLMKKLGKLTTVANPNLGTEWLDEVCICGLCVPNYFGY